MAMQVIRIQMNGNKHLISVAPHPSCGLLADLKRLLRCNLSFGKALYAVIADDLSFHSESALYGNHFGIGILLGAVYPTDVHFLVGFVIVFGITERRVQILIEVFSRSGLVRIICVFERSVQIPADGPESCNCHITFSPFRAKAKRR